MLIELRAGAHTFASEDGVLSARDVQVLCDMALLDQQMERERIALLDEARLQARSCVEEAGKEAEEMMAFARAQADPEAITAAARAKAAQMLERAHKDAKRLRQEAVEEGRRQGQQESAVHWHEKHLALSLAQQGHMDSVSEKMVRIVMAAVERIVESEPREALFKRAAKNVQHLVRGAMSLKLKVSPQELEHANEAMASLHALHGPGVQIDVIADQALPPGACIFESEVGVLDASLNLQLDGLRAAMGKALAQSTEHPPLREEV